MTFARDPGEEEREEQERLKEVGFFYKSLLVLAAAALLLYWVATGRPWWRDLSAGEPALDWGRLAVRALSVPLPSLVGAFMVSDARTWWAPLAYIVYLLLFTVLLWIGTGTNYLRL